MVKGNIVKRRNAATTSYHPCTDLEMKKRPDIEPVRSSAIEPVVCRHSGFYSRPVTDSRWKLLQGAFSVEVQNALIFQTLTPNLRSKNALKISAETM